MASTTATDTSMASHLREGAKRANGIMPLAHALTALVLCGLLTTVTFSPRRAYANLAYTANASIFSGFSDSTGVFDQLNDCKGQTADQALDTARLVGIDANFKDSSGATVTEIVEDASNNSKIHKALVTEVRTYNYWVFGRYVTFVLDYSNPTELALYEELAADDAARKQASKDLDNCVGRTADQAYELTQLADCKAKFLDSADVDVTSIVADTENGSDVHEAIVIQIVDRHKLLFFKEEVTLRLDYEEPVAKKKREEKEAKERSKNQAVDELSSCEGKTAKEAEKLAETLGYEATFLDKYGVDITRAVVNGLEDSEVANALVSNVDVKTPSLFSPGSVTIKLDYVDPDAELERNGAQLRMENREEILNSVGKSAGKTQELVESSGFALQVLDKYGVNITNTVRNAKKGSQIRRAGVTSVNIDDTQDCPLVTIEINYVDLSSAKEIAEQDGYSAEVTITNVRVKIKDEDPTSKNPTFSVTVKGTVTNDDTWTVSASSLPALGTKDASYDTCAPMELDNGIDSLDAGESCGFTYHYQLSYDSPDVVLQTLVEGAQAHNHDRLTYKVTWWLNRAKKAHDAGLAKAK